MIRPFLLTLTPLLLGATVLTGCFSTPGAGPVQFNVEQTRLAEGLPPLLAAAPADRGSSITLDSVQIQPEKAMGYQNLPTTITAIYDGTPRPLPLADVVNNVLTHNRTLKIEGYTLRIAEFEIPVSKGIYDLLTTGLLQYDRVERQNGSAGLGSLDRTSGRTYTGRFTASQLFPTGATLVAGFTMLRDTQLTPFYTLPSFVVRGQNVSAYSTVASLELTQPLLRGFGSDVTNAGIRIAQLERRGAAADFQTQVEETLRRSLEGYWNLLGALELYKVRVISYSAARDLLRINEAKFRAGVLPRTDVLQAEAAAESRRELIIQQRQAVRDAEDELKRMIYLKNDSPDWNLELAPTQPFSWREVSVDLNEQIAVATARRPELRRAQSNIDQADVNLKVARNNKLPQLDAFGRVDTNATESHAGDALRTAGSGDYTGYSAGLQFSYPLQNRTARYRYKQAEARRDQAGEVYADTEDQITLEVRQSVRALRTARERIDVTQVQVRSEETKLANEMKRYEVGVSTAFQVLQFQEDLANAQSQHLQAVVDYNTALIRLERARGTLLASYGVEVQNAELNPHDKPVKMPIGLN